MPDIGVTEKSATRDLSREFAAAASIGRLVLDTTQDREDFLIHGQRPTIPFLLREDFSQEYIGAIQIAHNLTLNDLIVAGRASLGLSIEAALQVIYSKPRDQSVIEDTESLEDIKTMLGKAGDYVARVKTKNEAEVYRVAREVISSGKWRGKEPDLESSDPEKWMSVIFRLARERLKKKIEMIENYNRAI